MKVCKYFYIYLIGVCGLLTACARTYEIEGSSTVSNLDGQQLYLKILRHGCWEKIDSAEVIHGLFSMKGKIDTLAMVTLYIDEEPIMPVVLERGKIEVEISNTQLHAKGTRYNDALYEFIKRKNVMDRNIADLQRKEARMVLDGVNVFSIRKRLKQDSDSMVNEMNEYVRTFISDNYETVLGPSVFMMLCSNFPYPIMTPEVDAIVKDAPPAFTENPLVNEFLTKAKENMQLIEKYERMQNNAIVTSHSN